MDKELIKKIEDLANGRPYTVLRHVGNRIELMFYGDYVSTDVDIGSLQKQQTANMPRNCALILFE